MALGMDQEQHSSKIRNGGTPVAAGRWLDGSGSRVGSYRGANAKVAARVEIISLRCRAKWIHTLKIKADC